jgi:hypothetical protein
MRMTSTVRRVEKAATVEDVKVGVRERMARQRRSMVATTAADS